MKNFKVLVMAVLGLGLNFSASAMQTRSKQRVNPQPLHQGVQSNRANRSSSFATSAQTSAHSSSHSSRIHSPVAMINSPVPMINAQKQIGAKESLMRLGKWLGGASVLLVGTAFTVCKDKGQPVAVALGVMGAVGGWLYQTLR